MKLMIDIDDRYYEVVKHEVEVNGGYFLPFTLIANSTPLPKGHGRLIDENELIDEIVCEEIDGIYHDVIYAHSVYDANTVIEADGGSEDEANN